MKQSVSPMAFVSIIVAVLVIAGLIMWRVWSAPSSVRASEAAAKPVPPGPIPPEALRAKAEWNRTHPESGGATK